MLIYPRRIFGKFWRELEKPPDFPQNHEESLFCFVSVAGASVLATPFAYVAHCVFLRFEPRELP
jgi:hypothetical protein